MLKSELIEDGARIHHWSDEGFRIRQVETDIIYDDAVDIVPCPYTYEETDIPIPTEDDFDPDGHEEDIAGTWESGEDE